MFVEDRLDVTRSDPSAESHLDINRLRLAERNDDSREDHTVGDHDPIFPACERGVEKPERAHNTLGSARERACLEPYPFANPERARTQEHHAGDQVAQCLLRSETQHDRR